MKVGFITPISRVITPIAIYVKHHKGSAATLGQFLHSAFLCCNELKLVIAPWLLFLRSTLSFEIMRTTMDYLFPPSAFLSPNGLTFRSQNLVNLSDLAASAIPSGRLRSANSKSERYAEASSSAFLPTWWWEQIHQQQRWMKTYRKMQVSSSFFLPIYHHVSCHI